MLIAALACAPLAATSAAQAGVPALTMATATDGDLSASGSAAIDDLRVCLASQKTLNVYYLIDNSRSLERTDDGEARTGSDPDKIRASILKNSLSELGALSADGITVNWAAAFFATKFDPTIGWTTLTDTGPLDLEAKITGKTPDGYTNWPDALAGAQRSMADQQAAEPGCQLLIWLTDGELDLPGDGVDTPEFSALNQLCGEGPLLHDGGAPAQGTGIFNAFRQSGVVVVGALLAVDDSSQGASAAMQTLVEGTGPDASKTCGVQPMPATHVHGAFVEASAPDTLARVFLQLGAQLGGGFPQPFDADGSFWVDEGVARFRIVLTGDWTLIAPNGKSLTAVDPGKATSRKTDGATVVDVVADAKDVGQWKLKSEDARSLFLFSDLRVTFDSGNKVEIAADDTVKAVLGASVIDAKGSPADLSIFGQHELTVSYLNEAGERVSLKDATLDAPTGKILIPLPADLAQAHIVVTATIDPLVTKSHNLSLAPVGSEQSVPTVLPAQFPSLNAETIPVKLSDLEGATGAARGSLVVNGPTAGGEGKVCFGDATLVSDAANNRSETWTWTVGSELDDDGCMVVPQDAKDVRVDIAATNGTAADSLVQAILPVTFVSGEGEQLEQAVPVQFRSTNPVNTAAVLWLTLLFVLLGVLLPLVALWIMNRATTRIDVSPNTQRAAFPIVIAPGGTKVTAPTTGSALSDKFRYSTPSTRGERSITDTDLGALRARVSWWPLNAPRYEVTAPAGTSLITGRAGRTATGQKDGKRQLRFAKLPLDRFWAVVVSDAELLRTSRGDSVNGTVVIYHRASTSDPNQHAQRITEIQTDGALSDAVNRARAGLEESTRAKPTGKSTSHGGPVSPAAVKSSSVPPRNTPSSGAPPIPGRAPSTPPPRPGGQAGPPPRPGSGAPPPPRPSTPPPPRP